MIQAVRASEASLFPKLAFEFLVLTACRSGEVRLATWDEIDLDTSEWIIPGERMKAKRPHRVPLSGRALETLNEAKAIADGSGLVFPGIRYDKPLSDATLSKLLRDLGIQAVPHGFRSSFRDWAAERTQAPRAVMEAAPGACYQGQDRGGLRAFGPIRAAAQAHGRLGGLPERGRRSGRADGAPSWMTRHG